MFQDSDSSTTNRQCERCGTYVSSRFVRVFGSDGTVHGCLDCTSRQMLGKGYGAVPDSDVSEPSPYQEPAGQR